MGFDERRLLREKENLDGLANDSSGADVPREPPFGIVNIAVIGQSMPLAFASA